MSLTIDSIQALIKNFSGDLDVKNDPSITVSDKSFDAIVSNAFNKVSDTHSDYKRVVNALSQSPEFTSNPEMLQHLQNYLGEYSNYVSLVSALSRKVVSTIETLEKSQ
ncbi:type III secretion system inner rod subunit SctI [Pantoea sp. LMR881]|uniref:type III secretion system inner rod subunit SctI n=1 Tax=Pantoea sp. LMR881 TaxID=3014336 RepID=UPI0022B01B71|nr:type III secretion system inner rod subunit SctI [Pantoea sp. LMR881]MCZ4057954.1 type III secretion system inner rod subunit SctI [Pantoea sp. LMR881]